MREWHKEWGITDWNCGKTESANSWSPRRWPNAEQLVETVAAPTEPGEFQGDDETYLLGHGGSRHVTMLAGVSVSSETRRNEFWVLGVERRPRPIPRRRPARAGARYMQTRSTDARWVAALDESVPAGDACRLRVCRIKVARKFVRSYSCWQASSICSKMFRADSKSAVTICLGRQCFRYLGNSKGAIKS